MTLGDPGKGFIVEVRPVDELHALKQLLVVGLGDRREPPAPVDAVSRVVPEDEPALRFGEAERLDQIGRPDVFGSDRNSALKCAAPPAAPAAPPGIGLGDLHARDQDDPELVGDGFRQPVRAQQIDVDVLRVRLILGMLGQRDDVEAVPPRLLHVHGRPDVAVREHRVKVEVPLQGAEAGQVGHGQRVTSAGACPATTRRRRHAPMRTSRMAPQEVIKRTGKWGRRESRLRMGAGYRGLRDGDCGLIVDCGGQLSS